MEYVKGRPLDQLIPRNGMPVRERGEIPQSEWIEATDGSAFDVVPEFSPNGNLLYFQSQRDGSRCIWALRLEPATRRPAGAPFPLLPFPPRAPFPDLRAVRHGRQRGGAGQGGLHQRRENGQYLDD